MSRSTAIQYDFHHDEDDDEDDLDENGVHPSQEYGQITQFSQPPYQQFHDGNHTADVSSVSKYCRTSVVGVVFRNQSCPFSLP